MSRRSATAVSSAVPDVGVAGLLILGVCGGIAAAAVGLLKLRLGIPGSSIVLAALPIALGVSLIPHRLAGSLMSVGALGTAWLLSAGGAGSYGPGSLVSLCLLGPMMDLVWRVARSGRRIYASLVFAGVASNLLALGSRAAAKLVGLDGADARPFDSWWMQAAITYTLSGVVAGLIGAVCWFQFRDRSTPPPFA